MCFCQSSSCHKYLSSAVGNPKYRHAIYFIKPDFRPLLNIYLDIILIYDFDTRHINCWRAHQESDLGCRFWRPMYYHYTMDPYVNDSR